MRAELSQNLNKKGEIDSKGPPTSEHSSTEVSRRQAIERLARRGEV